MSYAEVSRATHIPESTVRRRMERLQQQGVIEFAILADPVSLGYDVRAMVGVTIDPPRLQEIAGALRSLSEVTFAAFLTGRFDIVVHIVVRSQGALVAFLTEQLAVIPGVRTAETLVMPYIIKRETAWALPDEPVVTKLAARTAGEDVHEARSGHRRLGRPRQGTGR